MILPGLVSLVFYKRRPSRAQIALGVVVTILLSAILGYVSPGGALGREGSVIVAVAGGLLLYLAILAYLYYRYIPQHTAQTPAALPPTLP
jgi:hypothetical protein